MSQIYCYKMVENLYIEYRYIPKWVNVNGGCTGKQASQPTTGQREAIMKMSMSMVVMS